MTIALFLSELIIYHIKNALFSTLNEDYFGKQNKKGGPCIVYCFSYYGSSFFCLLKCQVCMRHDWEISDPERLLSPHFREDYVIFEYT